MNKTNRSTAALLQGSEVFKKGRADVSRVRERTRRRRLWRLVITLGLFDGYLWYRYLTHNPFALPALGSEWVIWLPFMVLILLMGVVMLMPHVQRALAAHGRASRGDRGRAGRGPRPRHPGRRGRAHARCLPGLCDVPRRARRQPSSRHPVRRSAGDREDLPGQSHGQAGGRPVPVHLGPGVPVDVVRNDRFPDPSVLQDPAQARPQGGRRDRVHRGDRRDRREIVAARAPARTPRVSVAWRRTSSAPPGRAWSTSC